MPEKLEDLFSTIAEEATEYPGEAVITLKARLRNIRELCAGGVEQMHAILRAMTAEKAPELLEALKGMLELESHTHRVPGTVNREWRNGIVDDARAIVTKATGATPEKARAEPEKTA